MAVSRRRPPNASDRIAAELTATSLDLSRFSAHVRRRVVSLLELLRRELEDEIRSASPGERGTEGARRAAAERLIRQVEGIVGKRHGQAAQRLDVEMRELADFSQGRVVKALNDVFTVDLFRPTLTAAHLRTLTSRSLVLGAPASDWWDAQAEGTRRAFAREIRLGSLRGETNEELVRRVRGRSTGKTTTVTLANGRVRRLHVFEGGVLDATTRQAEALVRTSIQSISNDVLLATYREVAPVLRGYAAVTTLDGRTSDVCIARTGAAWDLEGDPLPESTRDEPFPGAPPWHWRAVVAGECVRTSRGDVPIEAVVPGDLALTHAGVMRRVYATMGKDHRGDVLRIELDSGRTIRVTHEHPLLCPLRGWVRADAFQLGDHLVEHAECRGDVGRQSLSETVADDHPAGFDESFVPDCVALLPSFVAASVDLQRDLFVEGEVDDEVADQLLELETGDAGRDQLAEEDRFAGAWVGAQVVGAARHDAPLRREVVHRVVPAHLARALGQPGELGFGLPEIRMGFAAEDRRRRQDTSFGARTNGYAMDPTASRERSVRQPEVALQRAERPLFPEVFLVDQPSEARSVVVRGGFLHTRIVRIVTEHVHCRVYNLGVEREESYVVGGIVVHNCRTILGPITKSWSELLEEVDGKQRKLLDTVPDSVRASFDGLVPGRIQSFDDFFQLKGEEFTRRRLGPGLYDLWKRGRITTSQLVDQSGRPRTLRDLRAEFD